MRREDTSNAKRINQPNAEGKKNHCKQFKALNLDHDARI
jgi:hypothetical protein